MPLTKRNLAVWIAAAAFVLATGIGAHDLIANGPFSWHVEQPAFLQGLIELLVVGTLLTWLQRMSNTRLGLCLCAVVVALYLRRHAVDLALLVSGVYCYGIYSLGGALGRATERRKVLGPPVDYPGQEHARAVALGLVAITLSLWLPALVFGLTFEATRLLGAAVAGVGLLLELRRKPWRTWSTPRPDDFVTVLTRSLIVICLLAVLARSNSVIYYDSIWYGLRPDRVLFGAHGIYSWLGLTTQVHYYPKLYEVALAPLQGWGDLSFDIAFNVWGLLFLAAAIRSVARAHGIEDQRAWVIASALICYPAFAGVAETTKGDILGAAFVLFGVAALCNARRFHTPAALSEVLVFALLATGLRLATLPWLAVLFLATLLVWGNFLYKQPARSLDWLKGGRGLVVALTLVALVLVHYRTWLLTGTPLVTNTSTQLLLDRMGFAMRFPIGQLTGGEPAGFGDVFSYFHELALHPSRFVFHIFKWTGALWLVALAVTLLRILLVPHRLAWFARTWLPLAMGVAFPILLATNAWPERGGDGNYFLVPVACLCIVGLSVLTPSRLLDGLLLACGGIGLVAYLATANWVPGTARFSFDLGRNPFDAKAQLEAYRLKADLGYVSRYLEQCNRRTRVTGLLPGTGESFALPVRYEPLQEWQWNNPASFASTQDFEALLRATGTQLVVLPITDKPRFLVGQESLYRFADQSLKALVAKGRSVEAARRGDYRIYRMTAAATPQGCPLQ